LNHIAALMQGYALNSLLQRYALNSFGNS
jgi:hypothetical protein